MTPLIAAYDAGLLSNYGGGNVEWWQDYIRAELEHAHDHYMAQFADALQASEARETGGDIERVRRIVEVYFRPWGAAKAEEWEELSGDRPFDPTTALRLIEAALVEGRP